MSKKDKKMIICFFTIWTILMIIFGIVIILYLQSEYNNRLYNTTARIISKIHNEVPEKEAEIINKIYSNEDSKKEINSGKEILNKYGITKSTSTWGDTGMDFSYKVIIGISILFLLSVVSIYFAFLIYYRKQKTKWENLNTYCQNILNGIETINLTDEEEGIESIVKNDIYDVTMLLKQANKELTVTNKKTEKLIADISHQLKTPLTSISGFVETLKLNENIDIATRNRFLGIIESESDRLKRLIDDILLLSFIENKETNSLEEVYIYEVFIEVYEMTDYFAKSKNINVTYRFRNQSISILSNRDYIKQIFLNLIDNAIKYTPENKDVYIEVDYYEDNLVIKVGDNGIGIPREDINRIFERFYRVDKARSRDVGGTGLGLAITKHIVKSLNGTINVKSELGEGSEFIITIPNKNFLK